MTRGWLGMLIIVVSVDLSCKFIIADNDDLPVRKTTTKLQPTDEIFGTG